MVVDCPVCRSTEFLSLAPAYRYSPRRWPWPSGPEKQWVGDYVRCPQCGTIGLALGAGVVRIVRSGETPAPNPNGAPAPAQHVPRPQSQIHDPDLKWR